MSKVVAAFAMSLDGFIADADDGVWKLYEWLINGDTEIKGEFDRPFKTSPASAASFMATMNATGAHVTGRRDFDLSNAWGGKLPMRVPSLIVTHQPPQEWTQLGSPFIFVTEGVERAIRQAQQIIANNPANQGQDKIVLVGGSQIVQQALQAGLIDALYIDLMPILLGCGIRLFDHLGSTPIPLKRTEIIDAPGVTHLKFRVTKS